MSSISKYLWSIFSVENIGDTAANKTDRIPYLRAPTSECVCVTMYFQNASQYRDGRWVSSETIALVEGMD